MTKATSVERITARIYRALDGCLAGPCCPGAAERRPSRGLDGPGDFALPPASPQTRPLEAFSCRTVLVLGGCAVCATVGLLLHSLFRNMAFPLSILVEALALKLMFSAHALAAQAQRSSGHSKGAT